MRVSIFGAGAIGGLVGMTLHRAGADVSVVARGEQLRAIRENGLSVDIDGSVWSCRPPASEAPTDLGPQDMVVIAVKAPSLPKIANQIEPLLHERTAVAFLMNGVPWWYFHAHGGPMEGRRIPLLDPGDAIWNAVGPQRVIAGVVRCAATVNTPGIITVTSSVRKILLGEPDGQSTDRSRILRDLLCGGGIEAGIAEDIRDAVWDKLVGNLMDGPLAVLTGARSDVLFSDESCCAIARAIGIEAISIGHALGRKSSVDLEQTIESGRVRVHLPSIAEDLQRGRPMEIDAMMSVPIGWAKEFGVPVPVLTTVADLVKMRGRSVDLY